MRIKTILSTAVFIFAFVFSTAFASLFISENTFIKVGYLKYKSIMSSADAVSALIREDVRNGRRLDGMFYGSYENPRLPSAEFAGAVEQYVDDSSSIKTSHLPFDFQTTWREHMRAWREYSEFLNRTSNSSNRDNLSSEALENFEKLHSRDINHTWREVLQTGIEYGADVPQR
ncbi:MAG: hypothetical protein M3R14_04290 [Acidobacteriota bacterium]|nr:hypothetical protein [Acidobacteriota bacterium]